MTNQLISVIVPVKEINEYILEEIIPGLRNQAFQNFELIILPDKAREEYDLPKWARIIPSWPQTGPADKRDLGAEEAKGKFLAFIDDDAYPDKRWLQTALGVFKDNPKAGAVCGPGVTPPNDALLAQVSGWLWSTWLGAGGAGIYRCLPKSQREVDDYPTFNLIVKKVYFQEVGGFNSNYWPGEDTKFCRDLVYSSNKKIIYHPKVKVYHHRRKIFIPHLRQISRYGFQRGLFAKKLPKTSNRIGYWVPGLFVLGLIFGPLTIFVSKWLFLVYTIVLLIYSWLMVFTFWQVLVMSKNIIVAFLTLPTIFFTHLVYGIKFLQGYFCTSKV